MPCPEIEKLERFVKRELSSDEARALEQHVATCAECRQQIAHLPENLEICDKLHEVVTAGDIGAETRETEPGERRVEVVAAEDDETVSVKVARAAERAPLPPDSFPGYRIIREVSRGGQGVIYQAVQESTHRKVAIKVLKEGHFADPTERARFEREVQVLGQLNHPNIVMIHDSGTVGANAFYVMDYISGKPLDAHVSASRASIDENLKLFAKVCDAVHAAHLRGIIHRDLKPGNIRIDADGEPHVLDFGLAKISSGETDASLMTMTGQFLGSLPWSSPEQAEGMPSKIDIRSDVYSLGVVLYQMLTGKFPYEVVGRMRDVLDRIMRAEPAKPSTIRRQINDEVETIVLKCLAKERDRRYQSAGEVARDVRHYLAGDPIEAKRDSGWYVLKKTVRRHTVSAAVTAGFLVLIAGFSVVMTIMYRRAARAEAAAVVQAEKAEQIQAFLAGMLASADPYQVKGADVYLRDALDEAAEQVETEFTDQPEIEAALRDTIGVTYVSLGLYDQAKPHLTRALAVRRMIHRSAHPDLATSMHNLASLLHHQGDFRGAALRYRSALAMRQTLFGNEHPDVAATLDKLGQVLYEIGEYDQAEPLYAEALKIRRGLSGDEHQADLATTLSNLALLLNERGEHTRAKALWDEALALRRRLHGNEHPAVAESLHNLAGYLQEVEGDLPAAEQHCQEALAIFRSVYGTDHKDIATVLHLSAWIRSRDGDVDGAELRLREALRIRRNILDEEHDEVLQNLNALIQLLCSAKRDYAAAEPLAQELLAIRRKTLPKDDPAISKALVAYAQISIELDKHQQALDALNECLASYRRRPPADDWRAANAESMLGGCLAALRRYAEAEPYLRDSYPRIEAKRGAEDRFTMRAKERLDNLYEAWGQPDAAQEPAPAPTSKPSVDDTP